ncbi:MAG: hypothetical protein V2J89_16165 [Halieaceae bacterium]|jgi:chromosome segregation ATPase|nr:hypothetical protein [Halieaceae bacterium]
MANKRPADTPGDLDNIPSMVPARDEVASRQARGAARNKRATSSSEGGAGLLARLFICIALVVAAVACAWAWQLQQSLERSDKLLLEYETRIADLEARLSDTDEGLNESAAAMSVKIKELYSEVDKLWASAWRRNKAKIADLEASRDALNNKLATLEKTDAAYSSQLKSLGGDLQKLRDVAGDLDRLITTADANQALLERLGDDVSRAALETSRLQKRLQDAEEWQASVDAFRRQVNQTLLELRQGLPPAAPAQAPPAG